ncbi:hypothetical protein OPV22_009832 [Ensete ventricosum]|uniref:Uncharacterized protein n=1 Tax=Ensete ventricosum TaxID=4639 RepID=A0AAV8Q0R8_ENSVE|nr:hypothetical protein OPV22_009832 [Ensete ventricosum]
MNQAKEKKASRADIASHRHEIMAKEANLEILASGTTLIHCLGFAPMVSVIKSRDKHDCHWTPAMALLNICSQLTYI